MQSHPLRRTRFSQYQASSAALGWPGDGDCYNIMRRMQSGGWPYSKSWYVCWTKKGSLLTTGNWKTWPMFRLSASVVTSDNWALDRGQRKIDVCSPQCLQPPDVSMYYHLTSQQKHLSILVTYSSFHYVGPTKYRYSVLMLISHVSGEMICLTCALRHWEVTTFPVQ